MKHALVLVMLIVIIAFAPAGEVQHNGCYRSTSSDHTITGLYYLRFYPDGSVIEYEQPGNVRINFDKATLSKIMQKESTNEKFPLKKGQYFIKDAAIKITLTLDNETVIYEGTVTKYSIKVQRHSTRTNQRTDMELSFQKIGKLR